MLVVKQFETECGEIYDEIPFDLKTKKWVYGVTWEEIGRIMEVAEKYNLQIDSRGAAKIILNLDKIYGYQKDGWTDEQIKKEIEIYIWTYDDLDNFLSY